ncbi:hypothetical protein CAP36_07120 [Chitinophagaceae bacterium IBVUCB2]|nr:hypothetical protein CAP36_07120 [Chitinophagaceae bacterium IBVUCB2]
MKKIFPLLLFIAISFSVSSQQSVYEIMERTDISIDEAKRQADRLFETIGTGRGTGYKHFQRWYYERKFHVDENGFFISAQEEWNKYLQSQASLESIQTEAANWTELGPKTWVRTSSWNPGTGRLTSVAIHPSNESIIYVSSPGGGIWKTTNAGATWAPLVDDNPTWMSVFSLAIDPANQNIVYAGTSGSNGLIKSTDAGASWSNTGSGPSGTIYKILIHPTSTNIVFACTSAGLYRSINGGTSWTQVRSGHKEDIEFKPNDLNIMYAVGNAEVVRSTDMGVSWTAIGVAEGITNTGRSMVAVSPANPNYVYIVQASGNLFGRMYKSTDAGLNYTTTVVGNPGSGTNFFGYETNGTGTTGQAGYDMALDVSPTNAAEVYIAGIICWKSINEGSNFTAITAWSLPNSIGYNHADVHGLYWINSTIYSLSDGGIFKSLDAGDNWIDISNGLGIRQFYRFDNSPTNPNVITGGAQDNGSATRQASGNWVDWLGADGMEGLVSPTNHLNLWGTSQNGSIYRSTNGGNSYTNLTRPAAGDWVTPLEIHPTNEAILYGGWTGVWKSVNGGSSWSNISSGVISSLVTDLALAPSAPTTIYASRGATLWVTTDDGANWVTRTAPATINDIAVDPTNPSKIWIACNSASNRIFVSTDGGANFTNISSNLPGIAARAIVVDDATPCNIYVGMNIGVYHQQEGAGTWTNYSDNLPMVAINELDIQQSTGVIRVATYGRGVWESPVATKFKFNTPGVVVAACPIVTLQASLLATYTPGITDNIILTSNVAPAGPLVTLTPSTLTTTTTSTVVVISNAASLPPGTYTVTITGTAGSYIQRRDISFVINAGTGPVITTAPASQIICAGESSTFNVISTGVGLTYQWQISTPIIPSFTDIPTATASSYTATGATAGMNGNQYRVVVSGACSQAATSSAATLTVISPVTVATQVETTREICSGSNTNFNITGSSSQPINYQWQVNTGTGFNNISNGGVYSGATAATLTITNAPTSMSGYTYRVQLSNTTCTAPTISGTGTLTVRQLPTVGLTASLTSLLPGQTSTLTATPSASTGGTLTTSWLYNGAAVANTGNSRPVTVEQIGAYRVTIQEAFSGGTTCTNQSAEVVIAATVSNKLFIFPSPNDGNFTVSYYNNGGSNTSRTINIYDAKGNKAFSKIFPIAGPYTLIPINMSNAARGIYFVVVGDASGRRLAEGKVHVR